MAQNYVKKKAHATLLIMDILHLNNGGRFFFLNMCETKLIKKNNACILAVNDIMQVVVAERKNKTNLFCVLPITNNFTYGKGNYRNEENVSIIYIFFHVDNNKNK